MILNMTFFYESMRLLAEPLVILVMCVGVFVYVNVSSSGIAGLGPKILKMNMRHVLLLFYFTRMY